VVPTGDATAAPAPASDETLLSTELLLRTAFRVSKTDLTGFDKQWMCADTFAITLSPPI
jgi:hypothetical protein